MLFAGLPEATVVDLSHSVPPQNVFAGALFLADAAPWFPPGTLHIAVVDPGVGTERELLCVGMHGQTYLAPNNGLLSFVERRYPLARCFALTQAKYWRPETSSTFHGRDILASVAVHLALGLNPDLLGPAFPSDRFVRLAWPEPTCVNSEIAGEIVSVDDFGNALTNIEPAHLGLLRTGELEIAVGPAVIRRLVTTYGMAAVGEPVALIGSHGRLEIALVNGNAACRLELRVGMPVTVRRVGTLGGSP